MRQIYNPLSGKFDLINTGIYTVEPNVPIAGDIWFDSTTNMLKTWNGEFWQGAPTTVENFIYQGGDTITFGNGSSNGSVASITTLTALIADINSATTKARTGMYQVTINATASAFAATFNSSVIAGQRYSLETKGGMFLSYEWRQSAPAAGIDFANDPVLQAVGLVTYTATTTVNPATGIYFRLPRQSESQFVKYVVREGSVETVFSTGIAITSNFTGYVKTALLWDGANDTMHFITGANGVYDTKSITTFSVSFPTAFAASFHSTLYLGRNGMGAVPATTTINIDKAERYIFNNYLNYV